MMESLSDLVETARDFVDDYVLSATEQVVRPTFWLSVFALTAVLTVLLDAIEQRSLYPSSLKFVVTKTSTLAQYVFSRGGSGTQAAAPITAQGVGSAVLSALTAAWAFTQRMGRGLDAWLLGQPQIAPYYQKVRPHTAPLAAFTLILLLLGGSYYLQNGTQDGSLATSFSSTGRSAPLVSDKDLHDQSWARQQRVAASNRGFRRPPPPKPKPKPKKEDEKDDDKGRGRDRPSLRRSGRDRMKELEEAAANPRELRRMEAEKRMERRREEREDRERRRRRAVNREVENQWRDRTTSRITLGRRGPGGRFLPSARSHPISQADAKKFLSQAPRGRMRTMPTVRVPLPHRPGEASAIRRSGLGRRDAPARNTRN